MALPKSSAKSTKSPTTKARRASGRANSDTPTLEKTLQRLESLGQPCVRAQNAKRGAGDNQFGVARGDIRKLANQIKRNHPLAVALWNTGNIDAQFLATLLIDVRLLSAAELERMIRSVAFDWVADWLHTSVVREHPDKETLRQNGMESDNRWMARVGWQLTAGRVAKSPEGLELVELLVRIEKELGSAAPEVQWTMNACLAEIGIRFPRHRPRAIAIGEKWGLYRDYPCSKGCTSPFAPIWINEMVRRQG